MPSPGTGATQGKVLCPNAVKSQDQCQEHISLSLGRVRGQPGLRSENGLRENPSLRGFHALPAPSGVTSSMVTRRAGERHSWLLVF